MAPLSDPEDEETGEARALRELLESSGWAILKRAIDQQWGPRAYGLKMRALLRQVQGDTRQQEVARQADQLEATCNAVDEVIAWPAQRLRQLETRLPGRAFADLRRVPE